jgi:hypothetical protein
MNIPKNPPPGRGIKSFTSIHKKTLTLSWAVAVMGLVGIILSFMLGFAAVNERFQGAYFTTEGGIQKADFYTFNDPKYRGEEVRVYLKEYLNLMFSFDRKTFKSNVEKGVDLGGKPAQDQANYYITEKYLETMVGVNANCRVEIDSIPIINVSSYPYYARIYARQIIEAPQGIQQQRLWVECELVNLRARDKKNPYALEIKLWRSFNLDAIN